MKDQRIQTKWKMAHTGNNNLAIVIPAYKIRFFESVLESFKQQTDKRFNIYVGVDASKENFESIVDKYSSALNIKYKRFGENFGGKDLVAQWNRCVDMVGDEEWIWLFSDDDMLEPTCVESFYKEIKNGTSYDLYHFNVDIIDENNKVVKHTLAYPQVLDSVSFLKGKNSAKFDSFVVEYIFRRSTFEKLGGFQHFDMAWGTDIATWAKIGREKGIKTISDSKVCWRQSTLNITPNVNKKGLQRKLKADVSFFIWCRDNFKEIGNNDIYYYMFRMLVHYTPFLKVKDFEDIVDSFYYQTFTGKMWYSFIKLFYPILGIVHKAIHPRK